jgi:hypothetical protein
MNIISLINMDLCTLMLIFQNEELQILSSSALIESEDEKL